MQEENNMLLSAADCPSAEVMQKYISEALSDKERNTLERHALECDICADAIAGFADSAGQLDLVKENKLIRKRMEVFFTDKKPKKENLAVWAAAASFTIIIGATILFFFSSQKNVQLSSNFKETSSETIDKSSSNLENLQLNPDATDNVLPEEPKVRNNDNAVAVAPQKENSPSAAPIAYGYPEAETSEEAQDKQSSNIAPAAKEYASQGVYAVKSDNFAASSSPAELKAINPKENMLEFAETQLNLMDDNGKSFDKKKTIAGNTEKKQTISNQDYNWAKPVASDTLISLDKSSESKTTSGLHHAIEEYNRKNFRHANEILDELLPKNRKDHTILLYSILSKLQLNKNKEALSLAEQLVEGPGISQEQKNWLLATANLELNKDEAIRLLSEIAKGNSSFASEAASTLRLIK